MSAVLVAVRLGDEADGDPEAALGRLVAPGAVPSHVGVVVRAPADAIAAATMAGAAPSAALAAWCADAADLRATLGRLRGRTVLAVAVAEAQPADAVAAALGLAAAATGPAKQLLADLLAAGGGGDPAPAGKGSEPPLAEGAEAAEGRTAGANPAGPAGPAAAAAGAATEAAAPEAAAKIFDRAAAAWQGAMAHVLAGDAAGDPARLAARVAELLAERDLLADALAEVQHAWRRVAEGLTGPRRDVIDIAGDGHPSFYDREEADGRPFRWLGRAEAASFDTLLPRLAPVRVDLLVEAAVEGALAALEVSLDGEPPADLRRVAEGARTRLVALFPPRGARAARLTVRAKVRVDMTARGDPRTLSVGLSRIFLEEVPSPSPWLAAASGLGPGRADAGDFYAGPSADPWAGRPARSSADPRIGSSIGSGIGSPADPSAPSGPGAATRLVMGPRIVRPERPVAVALALPPAGPGPVWVEVHGEPAGLAALTLALNGVAAANSVVGASEASAVALATFRVERGGPARLTLSVTTPVLVRRVVLRDGRVRETPSPPPPACELRVEEGAFADEAFYGLERRPDGVAFRWLGRAEAARLVLPATAARVLRVDAHLVHAISDAALAGFGFGIDGRMAAAYDVRREGDMIVKSAILELGEGREAWRPLRLDLEVLTREDFSARGDPRLLAVALNKLVVTPL